MPIVLTGDEKGIEEASLLIEEGRQVVIPTETVYGLAANALDFDAVAEIFVIKGRPATNPLIVHVSSVRQADSLGEFNDRAVRLAEAFWPGPLTIVIEAYDVIPSNVTAGGTTVGIRMPNHPLTLQLLEACCLPLAAPSANRSEGISPTTVDDVIRSLGELSPPILDGGACTVGIESTVVDVSQATVRILRPGAISRQQIESVLGEPVEMGGTSAIIRSPGQMKRHYAPSTPAAFCSLTDQSLSANVNTALLYYSSAPIDQNQYIKSIQLSSDPAGYAAGLYTALNILDQAGADSIAIELPPDTEEWLAIRDRLSRAVTPKQ
jgi:L-threonylcarbamoyladenylate synthase